MDNAAIAKLLAQTRLVLRPKTVLATFGATRIRYHIISSVDGMPGKTRLREGWVVSEKPKILTAEALRDRFSGFGEEAGPFMDWLSEHYRDLLRVLEYRFQNRDLSTRVLSQDPRETAENVKKDADERNQGQTAVIECPDAAWSLALMHFTLDAAARAYPVNVRDLDTHGLFEPGSNEARRRRAEIERMFQRAAEDAGAREKLGATLRECGLFEEYEDRFLGLFR
ncbi:MAG: hypothetical protein A2X36_01870 [Elusimicrobia bacterium GWA2_69_24]|nr:MAG: hypothetical protein A2X36_01870 [Elusimicrobia bacterium GWA2_69_24]